MVGVGPRHRKPPGTPQRSRATAACLRGPHRGPRSLLWRMARSTQRERQYRLPRVPCVERVGVAGATTAAARRHHGLEPRSFIRSPARPPIHPLLPHRHAAVPRDPRGSYPSLTMHRDGNGVLVSRVAWPVGLVAMEQRAGRHRASLHDPGRLVHESQAL